MFWLAWMKYLTIHSRRKGLFSLTVSGSHRGHRAQLLWGLCVRAEHHGRSFLLHSGRAAMREPTCEVKPRFPKVQRAMIPQ